MNTGESKMRVSVVLLAALLLPSFAVAADKEDPDVRIWHIRLPHANTTTEVNRVPITRVQRTGTGYAVQKSTAKTLVDKTAKWTEFDEWLGKLVKISGSKVTLRYAGGKGAADKSSRSKETATMMFAPGNDYTFQVANLCDEDKDFVKRNRQVLQKGKP